jgi:hypothetical protein
MYNLTINEEKDFVWSKERKRREKQLEIIKQNSLA